MQTTNNELVEVAFRVSAIYHNEKNIKLLGYSKDKETGVKTNIIGTIWMQRRDGETTKAYNDFTDMTVEKGDLLLTSGSDFSMWNDNKQFNIKIVSGVIPSKYKNEPQKEVPKQEAVIDDTPWELEL